jgi:hypothetical protein
VGLPCVSNVRIEDRKKTRAGGTTLPAISISSSNKDRVIERNVFGTQSVSKTFNLVLAGPALIGLRT